MTGAQINDFNENDQKRKIIMLKKSQNFVCYH